jgi:hypothetical protein
MAVLAVAFCCAHKIGEWQNEIKPIKIKNHGRKAMSFFRGGVNVLRRTLCGKMPSKKEIRRIVQILFSPPAGILTARLA